MKITPVKLPLLNPPKDDFFEALEKSKVVVPNESIVVVSSKIVAIHQGVCMPVSEVANKDWLIEEQAEIYLERNIVPGGFLMQTVKHHMLVGSAGIDESNANNHYILLPKEPEVFAQELRAYIVKKFGIKDIGVIITDSHSVPMRRGTIGVSIASWGFKPLHDYRGTPDLFNRELKVSISNLADGLAAAATVVMGEGSEQTPVAVVTELKNIQFINKPFKPKGEHKSYYVEPSEDLYKPFFDYLPWKKGGTSRDSKNN